MAPFRFFRSLISRLRSSRGGNVAMIFAFVAPVLAILAASSIDIGNVANARRALQSALDSSLLAAARSGSLTDADLTESARTFLEANRPSALRDAPISVNVRSTGTIGDMTLEGEAGVIVPVTFARILGRDSIPVAVTSEIRAMQTPQLQLSLILDTTGSMAGSKITTLRNAARDLVNYIRDRVEAPIAVVPFAQYANFGPAAGSEDGVIAPTIEVVTSSGRGRGRGRGGQTVETILDPDWEGCVGSPPEPYNRRNDPINGAMPGVSGVVCPAALTRLTTNRSTVLSAVASLNAEGWTNIPSGLMAGWRTLSPIAPFEDSLTFLEPNEEVMRVAVLMTDGANTRSQTANTPLHDSSAQGRADARTAQICEAMKDDGIRIYAVAFEISDSNTRRMLERCATEPSMYFNANSADDLNEAFAAIARDVVALYISG